MIARKRVIFLMVFVMGALATSHVTAETTWLTDLDAAIRQARSDRRPILLRFGGAGCPWCVKLESDLANDQTNQLADWTCVELDIDRDHGAAARFGVSAIPALRIVSPLGRQVASHNGYLPPEDFSAWLVDNREAATSQADSLLLTQGKPSLLDVVRLVRYLEKRDAVLREAAIKRLLPYPHEASTAVVKSLRQGDLASQLAALEILEHWQAPLEGIDPWRPDTLTEERLMQLDRWQESMPPAEGVEEGTLPAELDLAKAEDEVRQMLKVEATEVPAIRERLARYGELLLPQVIEQLNESRSDQDRERLLALRYRLRAPTTFVLEYPGLLERLADRAAETRRSAVEELATSAHAGMQPLLLELFSDPDPLVRELSLRGLKNVGGSGATAALARLLEDPELNVRAAVLKQLTEDASEAMLPTVTGYVTTEKDPDLIVHAVRYLREMPGEPAYNSLLPLLKHDSWRVRAEAAEALGKFRSKFRYGDEASLVVGIDTGLLALIKDDDPFVVSRAVEGLEGVDAKKAVEPLVEVATRHPSLAPAVVELLTSGAEMQAASIKHFRSFFEHDKPEVRAAAIHGLVRTHSDKLADEIPAALSDDERIVRLSAARSLLAYLSEKRPSSSSVSVASPFADEVLGEAVFVEVEEPADAEDSILTDIFNGLGRVLSGPAPVDPPDAEAIDLDPEKESELPTDESEAGEPADGVQSEAIEADGDPNDEVESEPEQNALDVWLNELYAGEHRPEWTAELPPLIEPMMQSESQEERIAAALILIPLGGGEQALPVLLKAAGEEATAFAVASRALVWLPWNKRESVFRELADMASTAEQYETLLYAMSEVPDRRAAAVYWELLDGESDHRGLGSAAHHALQKSLFGERYYDTSSLTGKARESAAEELRPHAAEGTSMKRIVAMTLLAKIKIDEVEILAREILDDDESEEALKNDAFQILLAILEQSKRDDFAAKSLQNAAPARQRLAITYLALGDNSLGMLSESKLYFSIDSVTTYYGSESGKPIIPAPPKGLELESVTPYLDHDDSQVAACAGYLVSMFGEAEGLPPLVDYWRKNTSGGEFDRLVYRAIAILDDANSIDHLKTIYARLDEYEKSEFYWTIRIMSGPAVLEFRKQIRDEVGMDSLR